MIAFATILVLISAFGQLNARHPALSKDCLNGERSAEDCCALVPRAFYAHLKHSTNCGQFYHCAHGVPVLKDCPAGLHWSVKMDRCEWPSIAKCNGTTTTTTTTTPKPTTTSTTPKPTTTSTTASTTTAGTTTDSSETSTCWTASISNDCRYGKTSADECCVGVSPWEDALLPNPGSCGTYIQCVHEKPMVRDCPAGLHWSPDACRCEWPSIAKCNGTTTTTTTTTTPKPTTTSTTTTTTPKPTTTSTTTTTTPKPTTSSTTAPTTTAGTTTDNSGTSTCWTASISNDCRYGKTSADECCVGVSPLEDALLPNPGSCGTYIQCVHEKPMVRDCPAGLHWSPDACRCEWPSIAKCNGTTTTTTTTTPKPTTTSTTVSTTTTTARTTTESSETSTCSTASISNDCRYGKTSADECCVGVSPWEDALLPNPDSCGTYIQCVHEKPMVRDCPAGLHWSPDECRCEWPSIAKCA